MTFHAGVELEEGTSCWSPAPNTLESIEDTIESGGHDKSGNGLCLPSLLMENLKNENGQNTETSK